MDKQSSLSELTVQKWHHRFIQQAFWTKQLRHFLYHNKNVLSASRILEFGCGTGVILSDLADLTQAQTVGLDIRMDFLQFASKYSSSGSFLNADGFAAPFTTGIFDVSICHFLLLWISHPQEFVTEMRRVTRSGGVIIALAEPDYGGRIDHPPDLLRAGSLQTAALEQQGADPRIGRKLNQLFHHAGLSQIQGGILGGQWNTPPSSEFLRSEREIFESDLSSVLTSEELADLHNVEDLAWKNGERVLFVPTFYAVGVVP